MKIELTENHLREMLNKVYASQNIFWSRQKWGMNKNSISDLGYLCRAFAPENFKENFSTSDYEKAIKKYGLRNLKKS